MSSTYVYFPTDCIISFSYLLKDGAIHGVVESVGNVGLVGIAHLHGR